MSKAIRARIKKIKKHLEEEYRTHGFINDGHGERYEIALQLLQLRDYKGILKYYDWFYERFPDDVGYPELHVCWIIAAIWRDNKPILHKHLVQLEDINTYVLPKLLGQDYKRVDKWEGMNLSTEEYADYMIAQQDFQQYIRGKVRKALEALTQSKVHKESKQQLIGYQIQLGHLPAGPKRSRAIEKSNELLVEWEEALNKTFTQE